MIEVLVSSFVKQINASVGKQTNYATPILSAILLNLVQINRYLPNNTNTILSQNKTLGKQ